MIATILSPSHSWLLMFRTFYEMLYNTEIFSHPSLSIDINIWWHYDMLNMDLFSKVRHKLLPPLLWTDPDLARLLTEIFSGPSWRGGDLGDAGLHQPRPGRAHRQSRPAGGAPGETGEQRGPAGEGEAAADGGAGASLLSPDPAWEGRAALQAGGVWR